MVILSIVLLLVATVVCSDVDDDGVVEPVKQNYSKRSERCFTFGLHLLRFVYKIELPKRCQTFSSS